MLQPCRGNSVASQSSSSGWVGRSPGHAEVLDGGDEAPAEEGVPGAVHHHPADQRVVLGHQPAGQGQPVVRRPRRQRVQAAGDARARPLSRLSRNSPRWWMCVTRGKGRSAITSVVGYFGIDCAQRVDLPVLLRQQRARPTGNTSAAARLLGRCVRRRAVSRIASTSAGRPEATTGALVGRGRDAEAGRCFPAGGSSGAGRWPGACRRRGGASGCLSWKTISWACRSPLGIDPAGVGHAVDGAGDGVLSGVGRGVAERDGADVGRARRPAAAVAVNSCRMKPPSGLRPGPPFSAGARRAALPGGGR